jgi:LysR family carnitine catabolism transcriptional activator
MDSRSSIRPMTDAAFMQANIVVKPLYECQHIATTGSLIESGLGISALPSLTLPLIGSSNIISRPLTQPKLSRSVGIITRLGRALSPAAQEFVKEFVKTAPQIARKIAGHSQLHSRRG